MLGEMAVAPAPEHYLVLEVRAYLRGTGPLQRRCQAGTPHRHSESPEPKQRGWAQAGGPVCAKASKHAFLILFPGNLEPWREYMQSTEGSARHILGMC